MNGGANLRPNPDGVRPRVAASSFLDPTALVIGNVRIGEDVFVGPGAVIRADEPGSRIEIGDGSNVQDRVVIHALEGSEVIIGSGTSLAHACIVHGPCSIGNDCFIGFSSIVFGATLGNGVVVKHLAVVEGVRVEDGRLVPSGKTIDSSESAERLEPAGEQDAQFAKRVALANVSLLKGYKGTS